MSDDLMHYCPTHDALHAWVERHCGIRIPRTSVCPNHQAPFEYLCSAYFEPADDQVVWAPRGGGKTRLGALATLLDLLHKPGTSVRILGGSLEQSLRMWEHLLPSLEDLAGEELERPTRAAKKLRLQSGSNAAVLTQSQRAVRGLRVQKLRCDEVELFDPDVWEAAQLITRSSTDGERPVRGSIEAISTYHKVGGLMSRLIDAAPQRGLKIVHWCLLEVLERCPPDRPCEGCPLWDECRGVAKLKCDGFVGIDDAIAMKCRVCAETWHAEMLCRRPSRRGRVFPTFSRDLHVREIEPLNSDDWHLAIDFGFNSFMCLWIARRGELTMVVDELCSKHQSLEANVSHIRSHRWKVSRVFCDQAGTGMNAQTAESDVQYLRRHGFTVKCRASPIHTGLEMIRSALQSAAGDVRLQIHPRCRTLIAAMEAYRYPDENAETPLKDGVNDHPIDALRYYFVNSARSGEAKARKY